MSVMEVCVLVLTIIFGMVGIYLLIVLHSAREALEETKQALKVLNRQLPEIMEDLHTSMEKLRLTTGSVQGGIQQATLVIGALSPAALTTGLLGGAKGGLDLWRKIRNKDDTARRADISKTVGRKGTE